MNYGTDTSKYFISDFNLKKSYHFKFQTDHHFNSRIYTWVIHAHDSRCNNKYYISYKFSESEFARYNCYFNISKNIIYSSDSINIYLTLLSHSNNSIGQNDEQYEDVMNRIKVKVFDINDNEIENDFIRNSSYFYYNCYNEGVFKIKVYYRDSSIYCKFNND